MPVDVPPASGEAALLLAHAASTLFMVGLIWFVQIVHYPLFDDVSQEEFPRFHARHSSRTTWVVGPPMLVELGSAGWLALSPPGQVSPIITSVGFGLVLLIWLSTTLRQVPDHDALGRGANSESIRRLVTGNWVRTVLWTVRGGIALAILPR